MNDEKNKQEKDQKEKDQIIAGALEHYLHDHPEPPDTPADVREVIEEFLAKLRGTPSPAEIRKQVAADKAKEAKEAEAKAEASKGKEYEASTTAAAPPQHSSTQHSKK